MKRYTKQFLLLLLPALILALVGFGVWRTSDDARSKTQSNILSALEAPELFELLELPGTMSGTGTHFEITDSDYINLTLDSSETIDLRLESVPEMITMMFEPSISATVTNITLSGLPASTTFYKYEDNYRNLTMFTTDVVGSYTYTQDLTEPHFVFIQPRASTKFIVDDATGGDCTSIGIWDALTKTCTLTTDVNETIQIDSDGITLDGNGHALTGAGFGFGVLLSGRFGVTVFDLTVTQFFEGIRLHNSLNNTVIGNTLIGAGAGANSAGVHLTNSDGNVVTANDATTYQMGFRIITSRNNQITGNFAENNTFGIGAIGLASRINHGNIISNNTTEGSAVHGILVKGSTSTEVRDNVVRGASRGMRLSSSTDTHIIGNTVSDTTSTCISIEGPHSLVEIRSNTFLRCPNAVVLHTGVRDVQVYNNNFLDIASTPFASVSSENIVFNLAAPIGGNYYEDFDESAEGCDDINSDGFCDNPKTFLGGQDNLPWTVQDGWSVGATQVTLTWDVNNDPDFESYRIYRSTGSGVDLGDELLETITNQSQVSFVDTTITGGQTYYYSVFVFDRAGLSTGGNEVSATP